MKSKPKLRFKFLVIILVFIVLLSTVFIFTNSDLDSITSALVQQRSSLSSVQDTGSIQVYFCPQDTCENSLATFLSSAEESIHCALYEVGLESVKEVLTAKSVNLDVKVVTDDDYLHKFNRSFVHTDRSGLMHNKFCIIDGKLLSTGSMNPTPNDASKNNNNLLLIESALLAQNYEDEFQELWNGTFKKGFPVGIPIITLGNSTVQNYFCPEDHCAERVKEELQKAKSSIYFMTFSFTHEGIANVLLLQDLEGKDVQGVFEVRQIDTDSKYDVLWYQLGKEKIREDGNKNNMHHKVFIIDNETVITGSFNPTNGGDKRNDENILIITDKRLASRYVQEFRKVWEEAEGVS